MPDIISVVGLNYGDEGKGKVVDYLASKITKSLTGVRYQGGPNAGHTVCPSKEFVVKLHQLPSTILTTKYNFLGPEMVINLEELLAEIDSVSSMVGKDTNVYLHPNATLISKVNVLEDHYAESSTAPFGSTKKGIAFAYSDNTRKKALKVRDLLLTVKKFEERFTEFCCFKQLNAVTDQTLTDALENDKEYFIKFIESINHKTTSNLLNNQAKPSAVMVYKKNNIKVFIGFPPHTDMVIAEGQLGALKDLTSGSYPYVTSSNTTNVGILNLYPKATISMTYGVVKAYCTAVGEGPFITEWEDQNFTNVFREKNGEFGATTGRPRRIGWFDAVATKYAISKQIGVVRLILTRLDSLQGLENIKVCAAYVDDNNNIVCDLNNLPMVYPSATELQTLRPVYLNFEGWDQDISTISKMYDLPENAKKFVQELANLLEVQIEFIGTGPERERMI